MKDFKNLTELEQTNVIMQIGAKLTGQEIWYWEGIVHLLREQDKEIERLNNIINNAIEYISYTLCDDKARVRKDISGQEIDKLIHILEGSDNNDRNNK